MDAFFPESAGDGRRAVALLEQALEAAPPRLARAAVLLRLAGTVAVLVGPRKAIDLYREARVEPGLARFGPRRTRQSRSSTTSGGRRV